MTQLNDILTSIENGFAEEVGPARCANPNHCEECVEADNMLLNLDPSDLTFDDLIDERCNWIFSFITVGGLRWLFPSIIRVALEQNPPQPSAIFTLLSQRTSDIFSDEQWIAILDLNQFCHRRGWISDQELIYV